MSSSSEPRARRATLVDVARTAGVSLGTASKALSSPHTVRPRTLDAVRAAVDALGYIPSEAGRMLVSRRTRMIGVVLPSLYHPIYAVYFHEFQKRLASRDYLVVALSSEFDRSIESDLIERLVRKGVDALILIGAGHDPAIIAMLERIGLPHIFAWAGDEAPASNAVGFSDRGAMREMIGHLAALGHRRIAMLNGDPRDNERARWRLRGVSDAAAERGIDLADVLTVPLTIRGGQDGMRRIIDARSGATALVCSTDLLAAGALHAARQAGLVVPRDISITGFDDIEMAALLSPALTTIRLPVGDLAIETADRILALLAGGRRMPSTLLPVTLVVRQSSARPYAIAGGKAGHLVHR